VYVSTWEKLKEELSSRFCEGSFVFTSLHIEEEMKVDHYNQEVEKMLKSLKSMGYKLLVDVSPRTLQAMSFTSFEQLSQTYQIDVLRADFGFTLEDLIKLSQSVSLCVNASMSEAGLQTLVEKAKFPIMAMHNFYPRVETGLDLSQLKEKNKPFNALNIPVLAFIPSDIMTRGPMHEGLPTCEVHRYGSLLKAVVELKQNGVDRVVVGDGVCSMKLANLCNIFLHEEILSLPIQVDLKYDELINQVMTIRSDSPSAVCRCLESRLYATSGQAIEPFNCIPRDKGSITMDNRKYLRYSGEIQILKQDYMADERVNVIGKVIDYSLLDLISPGMKVKFTRGE
jgi:uncharacterized protein